MSLPQQLAGCVVLVTGDRRAGDLRAAVERRGARVVHTPALTIVPHTADAELVERTRARYLEAYERLTGRPLELS